MHSPPSMLGNSNNQALLSNRASPQGNNQEPFSQVVTVSKKKMAERRWIHVCVLEGQFMELANAEVSFSICLWMQQLRFVFEKHSGLPDKLPVDSPFLSSYHVHWPRTWGVCAQTSVEDIRRFQRWPRLMRHPLQPLLMLLWVHLRQPVSKACKVKHICSSY